MGLLGSVQYKIISWAISTLSIALLLTFALEIPWPHVPMVLLIVLIGQGIGWAVAGILGFGSRG